MKLSEEKN